MADKQPKTITLPSWLSLGNLISIMTVAGAALGVFAANVSAQARVDERIARVAADQEIIRKEQWQLRKDIKDDLREMRDDIRQLLQRQPTGTR